MSDRSPLRSFLGRLTGGGRGQEPPPWAGAPGEAFQGTVLAALIRAESLASEAICHGPGIEKLPRGIRNVFGGRVSLRKPGSVADTVLLAGGMALAGGRVSVFVPFSAGLSSRVRGLADKRTPILVFVTVQGGDDLDALGAAGVPLAVAREGAHALDLALVGRRLAESALTPVVIALEPETAGSTGSWGLPPEGLVRDFLGAPSDPVEPPTPSQRILFGDARRRVPRWFDPDRPVLVGAAVPDALRAAREAGRRLFFDADLLSLLDEARDGFARACGRDLVPVKVDGADGARRAVVAEGRAAFAAAESLSGARKGERAQTAVLGVTWRSPFPEEALRLALARAEQVRVLARAPLRGAGLPALSRAVQRVASSTTRAVSAVVAVAFDGNTVGPLLGDAADGRGEVAWAVPRDAGSPSAAPRRESLLQRVRRDVPGSVGSVIATGTAGPSAMGPDASRPVTPPLAVRRFGKLGSSYDNVARFWGENAEPFVQGDPSAAAPDPYLALGAVPPHTAAFLPTMPTPVTIPVLDPERCTACGRCWSSCPDAAIPAVATGTAAVLEAAARSAAAGTETDAGALGRLERTFKNVAQRAESAMAKAGARRLDPAFLRDAWAWYAEKGVGDAAEREALGAAFERVVSRLAEVPLVLAPDLAPDDKSPAGALLIAFDPRSCRGCGTCAAECPESAITVEPRTPEREDAARAAVRFWEEIPDTPGTVVHRAERDERVGPLAAALLTRHAAFAVAGGGEGEAGSGTRLAARQVLAVVEAARQKATAARLEDLARLEERLRAAIREAMADAVTPTDLGALDAALRDAGAKNAPTAALLAHLEKAGERHAVDGDHLRRLAASALEIATLRKDLVEGEHGTGRARFGVVVVRAGLAWACHYPANPFGVPTTVESAASAPTAAVGLAETLAARAVEEARIVRRARLALEKPSDLPARERELDDLSWPGLDADEATACAPVLVLAARSGIHPASMDGMVRALACGLPVKVVLLDDGQPLDPGGDPVLPALARRDGFVVSTSVAHGAHLAESVAAAVRARVPAFVRVLAPTPAALGFAPDATVSRTRDAVRARIAPLVRYDPSGDEAFGLRLSLDGNPEPESLWVTDETGKPWTPSRWEERPREAEAVDREIAARWATLREWAGWASPFVEPLRKRLREEIREEHVRELAAARGEAEAKAAEARSAKASLDASWLKQRLLELAGYGKAGRS